jgi:hypothetical protein
VDIPFCVCGHTKLLHMTQGVPDGFCAFGKYPTDKFGMPKTEDGKFLPFQKCNCKKFVQLEK